MQTRLTHANITLKMLGESVFTYRVAFLFLQSVIWEGIWEWNRQESDCEFRELEGMKGFQLTSDIPCFFVTNESEGIQMKKPLKSTWHLGK